MEGEGSKGYDELYLVRVGGAGGAVQQGIGGINLPGRGGGSRDSQGLPTALPPLDDTTS